MIRLLLVYDLGQLPAKYWSKVLARDLSRSPQVVDRLTDIDVHGWLRPNPLTLRQVGREGQLGSFLSAAGHKHESCNGLTLPLTSARSPLWLRIS